MSRNSCGSSPRPPASATAWAVPAVTIATHEFATSFSLCPSPGRSPTQIVFDPIASNTGVTALAQRPGPPTSTVSVPCSAGAFVPSTGASRKATSWRAASAASRSVPSSPTVEVCTHTASGAMAGSAPSITWATESASNSIVTTTSAPATASATSVAIRAPASASGRARSGLRFQTVTSSPAPMRLRAMPAPMMPVPSTVTVFVTRSSAASSTGPSRPADRLTPPERHSPRQGLLNAASNAAAGGSNAIRRTNANASGAPDQPIHAGVLPLDRDRAVVADRVEHPEARLPRHVAVPGRDEVPAPPRVRPRQVRPEPAVAAVADLALRVLAVDVVDPVPEVPQEPDRVEVLPDEVARVPVQPERLPAPDRLQRRAPPSSSRRRSRWGAPRARTARPPRRTRRGSGSSGRRSRGTRRRSSTRAPAGTSPRSSRSSTR